MDGLLDYTHRERADRFFILMSAIVILGLMIIAGVVIGLGILHLAHELIIRQLYSAPLIDNGAMQGPDTPLSNAASRPSAVN